MSQSTVYLVTGANRGLGLGLVAQILEKHNSAFVYAGVRDPDNSPALSSLQIKHPNRLAVVKCVSADVEGNAVLGVEIEKRHGHLDTVIANAGICDSSNLVSEINPANLDQHFRVNVTGTIVLFQAVYGLLKKSASPRFIPIGSAAACLDGFSIKFPKGGIEYGATKAALNWATRKIHFENEWLIAFPLSPGAVDTDMLQRNIGADTTGMLKKMLDSAVPNLPTAQTVAALLIKLIDESTRENEGGHFVHVDGTQLPW